MPGNQPAWLAFFLLTGSDEVPLAAAPSNVCTKDGDLGDGVRGGRITSDGYVLFSGSQLRVRLCNAHGSGFGNDHAVDNTLVCDASPRLDSPDCTPTTLTVIVHDGCPAARLPTARCSVHWAPR